MAEIRWTPQAVADLESIAKFIATDSPPYARLFVLDVFRAIERLVSFPKSGRVVPDTLDPNIREILLGNYRIVYLLRGETVEMLTIYHAARLFGPGSLSE